MDNVVPKMVRHQTHITMQEGITLACLSLEELSKAKRRHHRGIEYKHFQFTPGDLED